MIIVLLLFALRRAAGSARKLVALALVIAAMLWLLSTPLVAAALARSLLIAPEPETAAPEVIVVASGGGIHGSDPEYDVPSYSSNARLIAGVQWWRQHPTARFIIAGVDSWPGGRSTRTIEVMRALAMQRGVPASAIELESWSTSTREHPLGLLKLRGITRDTRVGLVTSAWHMRRASREFRLHFRNVILHPVPARGGSYGFFLNTFLPDATSLDSSTLALHEWIGSAWYALSR
jgi:uncharacterized SAM-binding protein YcdF (DUF218 family)